MTAFARTTLNGCVCIVVFDTIASVISRVAHVRYEKFSVGSFLIYFLVGVLVSRSDKSTPLQSLAAGAVIGLCEATVGWWLSAAVLQTNLPTAVPHHLWPAIAVLIALSAAAMCAIGYMIESYLLYRIWPRRDSVS